MGVSARSIEIRFWQSGNLSASSDQCVHPSLELWPPSFKQFFERPPPLECSQTEDNWVYVEKGTFQISSAAIKRHGAIRCAYTPLYHGGDDFHTRWGETVADMKSGSPIETDFFKVECTADDKAKHSNIHAGIAPIKETNASRQGSFDLNVLMIGFDSVSRITWMRNQPKTYDYLVKVHGTVVLEGYNIVGDGTPQALLPILTGKTELELPEARRSIKDAKPVNGHPWIWKDFKKLDYVTQFAEDRCNIGTFTFRMVGFKEAPVDHYMRTYFLEAEKLGDRSKPLGTGSLSRHMIFLKRLLLKLKAHGIGDSITDWIEQWLTDRRQRVVVDGEVSNWKSVLSGVPQGSVLGPILFLIYINDLDDSITSNVLKFADDTKLFRKVNTDGDKQHLQNDLDRLVKWSEKWQMLFNFGKCKCLHTGHRNLNVNYRMGDTVLGTTVKEKDLGVTISADMKVSEQCGIAASKGNQILGLIRRNITYKGKKLIIPLYKAIVRPHLEYCIQAWRPYRKKDIDTLERIQRRATKMIPELRDLSYEERLKECGLTTLETRRLRGDQIEVFKILNGYENIDRNMFFSLKKDSRTRGHEVKLVKDQCRLDIRKHSFSQRTINEWNKLSTDCVTASSVNMFKNKVDTYLRRAGYK